MTSLLVICQVTCGEHSLREDDDHEVTLTVTEVILHPKYIEASSSGYDIAIYKVQSEYNMFLCLHIHY